VALAVVHQSLLEVLINAPGLGQVLVSFCCVRNMRQASPPCSEHWLLIAGNPHHLPYTLTVEIPLSSSPGSRSTKTLPNKQVTQSLLGNLGPALSPPVSLRYKAIRRHELGASGRSSCGHTRAIAQPGSSIPDMQAHASLHMADMQMKQGTQWQATCYKDGRCGTPATSTRRRLERLIFS
jgi:hypothetical protein